jgi:hypothetical protein
MVPNGRKPLTIVQEKQKETYTVDLVLVVEEKHIIECPILMFLVYPELGILSVSGQASIYEELVVHR